MRLLPRALFLATTLLAVAAIPASPARAQPASTPETDRARELHKAGDAAFKAGKLEEARTAYLAAWALKKHWQIATNLGDAELRTGRPRDAAEHLAYALREGAEMSPAQRDGVQKALDDAKKQIATVDLQVAPDEADVVVDGAFVGRSPLADPVFLAPGEHTIEVKRVGFMAKSEKVAATAGAATTLRVELVEEGTMGMRMPPPPGTATPMQPPSDEADDDEKSIPLIVAGSALAATGLGLGIGFLAASSSAASERDALVADLPGSNACAPGSPLAVCDEIEALDGDATGFGAAGAASLAVGAGIGIATVIYALWPGGDDGDAARIVPQFSPRSAGLTLLAPL